MIKNSKNKPTVYVVHCIDTEGPLHESLHSTFERLREIFGLEIKPTKQNLESLQNGLIPLLGKEIEIAKVFSGDLLNYHSTWGEIDEMLNEIMSKDFRDRYRDSHGNGWVYNWHCVDHVGFTANPRRRDCGFHNIFDHYRELIECTNSHQDGLYFHHHPIPFGKEAHRCATHFFANEPIIFEILARRIIDRCWFPCAYRPGFHAERPDSHWFLEQFIPFDFSNQATDEDYSRQIDLADGRFGDWRRAPKTWTPYHPSHDDYQEIGNCRRWIARCLNVGTRLRLLTQEDVYKAFSQASDGEPVVLAFTNHDFRDIRKDINSVNELLKNGSLRFPEVEYIFCDARTAMRQSLSIHEDSEPFIISIENKNNKIKIKSNLNTFGPQPFFAIKTKDGSYYHDNLDFQIPFREWSYVFDKNNFSYESIEAIGVASCSKTGAVAVTTFNPSSSQTKTCQI